AVYKADQLIGLAGCWIITKFYCGRYIEMDNVIVDPAWRSHGIGRLLTEWVKAKAQETGCKSIHLDVYAHNKNAHRFYFREGFMIEGFHMIQYL
ncbi:MAG TPA: GNAT family N-acetyltransferase, partial [Chitinophaga sp.]